MSEFNNNWVFGLDQIISETKDQPVLVYKEALYANLLLILVSLEEMPSEVPLTKENLKLMIGLILAQTDQENAELREVLYPYVQEVYKAAAVLLKANPLPI